MILQGSLTDPEQTFKPCLVLQTVETAYDGFYIISKIPFGKYKLRISDKQIDELKLQPVNDEILDLTSDDPFQRVWFHIEC